MRCASASAGADYHEVINFTFVEPQWENDFGGPGFRRRAFPDPAADPINTSSR